MKVVKIGDPKIIISNSQSRHNYFGWPTVARLQNGKIAVVVSGFRLEHICPFGKTVISYSEDEGETYTAPAPVIDTVLDDRDGGICTFGKSGVIVTSFNNTVQMQRAHAGSSRYVSAYLDTVTEKEEDEALGSTFRISNDCGVTFGKLMKSPITSPHGPIEMPDGNMLWVGRTFHSEKSPAGIKECISAYKLYTDGRTEHLGDVENISDEEGNPLLSCEPAAILLKDGRILVHIRVQHIPVPGENRTPYFTIYQCESSDFGKTWTRPTPILGRLGGSPPHLYRHSSGVIICTYSCREAPFTTYAMVSRDEGATWEKDLEINVNGVYPDMGYPSTVETSDGSLLTVFYAHPSKDEPAVVVQQKWRLEE